MGFRSYIRQFLVAILLLFRALMFGRGEGAVSEQEEKVAKIILFYGLQKLH